jgi:hypothetical protein
VFAQAWRGRRGPGSAAICAYSSIRSAAESALAPPIRSASAGQGEQSANAAAAAGAPRCARTIQPFFLGVIHDLD